MTHLEILCFIDDSSSDGGIALDPEVDDVNPTSQLKFTPASRRCIFGN